MTTLMLIRHGDTEWNVKETFRGLVDIELNSTGIKQARSLAKYLEDEPLNAVYSSPLKRALKTAEIIADAHHLNVTVVKEMIDMNFGVWQGMSHDIVKKKYNRLYNIWQNTPQLLQVPDGEVLSDVRKRAMNFINRLITRKEDSIAIISHRVIHKVIICALLGLDNSHFWNIRLDTCGVTTFVYRDEKFIIEKHNDTSFLKSMNIPEQSDF